MRSIRRWPLLLAGLALIAAAVGVGASGKQELNPAAQVALFALGSAFLGAFIYSQGHHDDSQNRDDETR